MTKSELKEKILSAGMTHESPGSVWADLANAIVTDEPFLDGLLIKVNTTNAKGE